jgi:hypothetical protein
MEICYGLILIGLLGLFKRDVNFYHIPLLHELVKFY